MKKKLIFILILAILCIYPNNTTYSSEEDENIDFSKAFSKGDENIDKIGSRIYNWSIYLPGDAVINKNPKATNFNMYSNSFKTNVSIQVLKNVNNLSLEEIYACLLSGFSNYQLKQNNYYDEYNDNYKYLSKIEKDNDNNHFIRIISITPESPYYSIGDEEEKGTYNEKRIYLSKNTSIKYIYIINISTDLQFYQQHKGAFLKIANSFRPNFDETNPNFKDLSDKINTYRVFENKIYGWEIELPPYWKLQGEENSICQLFTPLYSEEEINNETEINKPKFYQNDTDFKQNKDFLSISVVSSIPEDNGFEAWVTKEVKNMVSTYRSDLYEQISNPTNLDLPNAKRSLVVAKIKSNSKTKIIQGTVFLQGNGYRYKAVLNMKESNFNEKSGKDIFYRMLKSFKVTNKKSKLVGEILSPETVLNYNTPKEISLKKYNLKTIVTTSWMNPKSIFEGQLNDEYFIDAADKFDFDISNLESINLTHSKSGIELTITGKLSSDSIEQVIKDFVKDITEEKKSEVSSKILNVSVYKAKAHNIIVYKIVENYNIKEMEQLTKKDNNKIFNYTNLCDTHTYILKSGNDLYTITFSIPLINTSKDNLRIIKEIWKNVVVNNIKIGEAITKWDLIKTENLKK